jgi:hypothetical protein
MGHLFGSLSPAVRRLLGHGFTAGSVDGASRPSTNTQFAAEGALSKVRPPAWPWRNPAGRAALQPGESHFGIAWAGEEAVARVEVTPMADNLASGCTGWTAAPSWALWEYLWDASQPGEYSLMCRATSAAGDSQPGEHDPLRGGYMINFLRPLHVTIVGAGRAAESWGDAVSRLDVMSHQAEAFAHKRLDIELHSEFTDGGGI